MKEKMKCILRTAWWVPCMLLLMANAVTVRCIPSREFDSMLDTLRKRGFNLFCNAILTSDLQIDLLSYENPTDTNNSLTLSFTFLAPTDASLFALDMTQTASSYTETLRFHVVPRRLSFARLRRLPNGYNLPTLLSDRSLQLTRRLSSNVLAVSGVDISFPGLFYGSNVAVHGLAGILSLRSNNAAPIVPPIRSADDSFLSPSSSRPNSTEKQRVPGPVSFNDTSRRHSPPLVEALAVSGPKQAPDTSPVNGRFGSQEPELDRTIHPPANLDVSPVATPVSLPPMYPVSVTSMPPQGYSGTAFPAPESLESSVRKEDRVLFVESEAYGEKSAALNGKRNRENSDVGLRASVIFHGEFGMQCYAA